MLVVKYKIEIRILRILVNALHVYPKSQVWTNVGCTGMVPNKNQCTPQVRMSEDIEFNFPLEFHGFTTEANASYAYLTLSSFGPDGVSPVSHGRSKIRFSKMPNDRVFSIPLFHADISRINERIGSVSLLVHPVYENILFDSLTLEHQNMLRQIAFEYETNNKMTQNTQANPNPQNIQNPMNYNSLTPPPRNSFQYDPSMCNPNNVSADAFLNQLPQCIHAPQYSTQPIPQTSRQIIPQAIQQPSPLAASQTIHQQTIPQQAIPQVQQNLACAYCSQSRMSQFNSGNPFFPPGQTNESNFNSNANLNHPVYFSNNSHLNQQGNRSHINPLPPTPMQPLAPNVQTPTPTNSSQYAMPPSPSYFTPPGNSHSQHSIDQDLGPNPYDGI
ncbi:hypothetical protein TRFO_23509 [Tritrichomonas foetus]|uniref:Uncharacterized protein n=1 Tax=Tritrichomonas foetus TaxID=1144522 RepID=A0A1J4K9H3_9EUKA|nr:hypothetical protein TRFO_23509 [Tritrichomonas foetus]|eukprot:OHT08071.1 hypothetical protein TRFO_23509 [Tritrichomonas foetus]